MVTIDRMQTDEDDNEVKERKDMKTSPAGKTITLYLADRENGTNGKGRKENVEKDDEWI